MSDKLTKIQEKEVKKEVQKRVEKKVEQEIKKVEKKLTRELAKKFFRKTTHRTIKSARYMGSEFKNHASTAIIAAFSFLIALAWKDFIIKAVKENIAIGALEKYPYIAEFYTAIIITILAIIGIALVSKWAKKPEKVK